MIYGYGQLGQLEPSQMYGGAKGGGKGGFGSLPGGGANFPGPVPRYDDSGLGAVPGMVPNSAGIGMVGSTLPQFGMPMNAGMRGAKGAQHDVKPPKLSNPAEASKQAQRRVVPSNNIGAPMREDFRRQLDSNNLTLGRQLGGGRKGAR